MEPTGYSAVAPAAEYMGSFKQPVYNSGAPQEAIQDPHIKIDRSFAIKIGRMRNAKSIIIARKYPCEEHSVRTTDGTILKLWRIPNARHGTTRYSDEKPTTLPGVILWHGLGLSSASWVCNPSSNVHENFAFVLADSGFDVWLVDGRVSNEGGKKRWDFGIDEISYIDVPAVVDYVLNTTGRKTVSYVGFSQGTATAFAALSVSEELNRKINVFIALAPCIQPALPENTVIQSLINLYGPKGIYRILGSSQFLGTARKLIHQTTPHIHSMAVRKAFEIIFGWNCSSFGCHDRQAALLSHAFGRLPVKNVVQWFQIIKENNALLHYQEHEEDGPFDNSTQQRTTPTKYPLKHISTKLYLFAGSIDNLCHISEAKHHLPPHAQVKLIKNYNHLDLIWATDAKEKVWDYIIPILRNPNQGSNVSVPIKKTVSFARGTNYGSASLQREGSGESFSSWVSKFVGAGTSFQPGMSASRTTEVGDDEEDSSENYDDIEDVADRGEVDEGVKINDDVFEEFSRVLAQGAQFFVGHDGESSSTDSELSEAEYVADTPPEIMHGESDDEIQLPTDQDIAELLSKIVVPESLEEGNESLEAESGIGDWLKNTNVKEEDTDTSEEFFSCPDHQ